MNFSSVYFKIRGQSDQISNMDLVALYSLYNFWGSQKFAHSSKIWRKSADENGATSLCESFSRLQSKPPQSPVPCHHMADENRRALLPARTPACCVYIAPDTPPTGARAAVALPRDHARQRRDHWP